MSTKRFARIGEMLPGVLHSLGLDRRFREQRLLAVWPEVAGPEIAAHTRALRYREGELVIHVDHGAWMQQLHFIESDLRRRLRERVPGVALERIRFTARAR